MTTLTDYIVGAAVTTGVIACLWSFYLLRWATQTVIAAAKDMQQAEAARIAAETAAATANMACEELRKSLMRGSAVGRWHRPTKVHGGDAWYHHVLTAEGQLLLTDEQWQVGRSRAVKLLEQVSKPANQDSGT